MGPLSDLASFLSEKLISGWKERSIWKNIAILLVCLVVSIFSTAITVMTVHESFSNFFGR